jgi:proteasome lid subunit RPN8/RPN11
MIIPRHLVDQLIAHATETAPYECCGMIAARTRHEAARIYPATNAAGSETRYEIDGLEQMIILDDMKDDGLELQAVYHSHTHAPPVPSLTDVRTWAYPDVLCVIIGRDVLGGPGLHVRAFRIDGETVREEPLQIS